MAAEILHSLNHPEMPSQFVALPKVRGLGKRRESML